MGKIGDEIEVDIAHTRFQGSRVGMIIYGFVDNGLRTCVFGILRCTGCQSS